MKAWQKYTAPAMVLGAALILCAAPVLADQADSVRKATESKTKTVKPASGEGAKVDTFVDQNNDGVDDRRQRKVLRSEPDRSSLRRATERSATPATKSTVTRRTDRPAPTKPEAKKEEKKPPR